MKTGHIPECVYIQLSTYIEEIYTYCCLIDIYIDR